MSLTSGRGPLSLHPAGRFDPPVPPGVVYVEPLRRRVRGLLAGRTVIDSERVLLVHRPGHAPTYAIPGSDVAGVAAEPEAHAPGYVRVAWDAVDAWYEEDQQLHGHPRNPYHRVDCVPTSRLLRVEVAGATLVDTRRTLGVYETGLEPRLYVEPEAVLAGALVPSPTRTYCPYKGTASYWTAVVGGVRVEDAAWSYEDPLPESLPLRGMLSFYESRVDLSHDLPGPC